MKKPQHQYTSDEALRFIVFSCFYFSILGYAANSFIDGESRHTVLSTCLLVMPVVLVYAGIVVMRILEARKEKKLIEMRVAESNCMLTEMAENIAGDYEARKHRLTVLKRLSELLTAFLIMFPIAFYLACVFCHDMRAGVIGIIPCYFLFLSGASHIKGRTKNEENPFSGETLNREEYPALYEIADKAAAASGYTKKVSLVSSPGTNISICTCKDGDYIAIGAIALQFLSRDELYAAMLHEMAHSKADNDGTFMSLSRHFNFVMTHLSGDLLLMPYELVDMAFAYEKTLFDLVSSVYNEQLADRAMTAGNPEAAGSMLVKFEYLHFFDWEDTGNDFVSVFKDETPPQFSSAVTLEKMRSAIRNRADFWNGLIKKEIQPRSATHPIARSRLECLGIKEIKTPEFPPDSEDFAAEKRKLLELTDSQADKELRENGYAEQREENYLKPLKLIEEWEAGGCKLTPAGYRDVIEALTSVGRCSEILPICERVIAEFPDAAAAYAHFIYGWYLIHRFDSRGIEHLWRAADINVNYREMGFQAIGDFACYTGDSELLETYRAKALIAAQDDKDYENSLGTMEKNDCFTAEMLPEGQLEADIKEMLDIGGKYIEKIWLVRKTVSGHFRSQYVVKLADGTEDAEINRIMSGIFNYLDTVSDWNYGLFYYESVKDSKFYRTKDSLVYEKKGPVSLSEQDE